MKIVNRLKSLFVKDEVKKGEVKQDDIKPTKWVDKVSKERTLLYSMFISIDSLELLQELKSEAVMTNIRSREYLYIGSPNIKICYYEMESQFTFICEVYFNEVLVIPKFNLFSRFHTDCITTKWSDWVVEKDKQQDYENVLSNLKPIVMDIKKTKEELKEKEIQDNIDKIGV
ncbi:MAG: hypothetical protein ACRDBY_01005 [Cetobacterium sp.]